MNDQPLIEEVHVKFAGSSSEMFDLLPVDTEVVFTVKGTVKGDSRQKQTHGVRRVMNISITKVVEGVSHKVNETDEEPSLFDTPVEPNSDDDPENDESSSNVVGIGQGPQFSAGD